MSDKNKTLRQGWRRLTPDGLRHALWPIRQRMRSICVRATSPLLARVAARRPRNKKLIVFVSDLPRSREAKLAYGLQAAGWEVILLCKKAPRFDASKYFVEVRRYQSPWEALALCNRYRPFVFHVFASWNFDVAAAVIRHRPGRIVFDDFDVFAGMMNEASLGAGFAEQVTRERYCLENADGLCCRSLETQFAKRHLGYKYHGKRLLLLDCCWSKAANGPSLNTSSATSHEEQNPPHLNPLPQTTGERRPNPLPSPLPSKGEGQGEGSVAHSPPDQFHLVYCGNVLIPSDEPLADSFFELVGAMTAQGIHLHVFPSPEAWSQELVQFYARRLGRSEFFHLENPVPPDELTATLAQFDAGLFDARWFSGSYDRAYTKWKMVYASTNKIFDYLDAGLPILVNSTTFQESLVKRLRLGTVIRADFQADALHLLMKLDWGQLKKNVARARDIFAVPVQAERLAGFYASLN